MASPTSPPPVKLICGMLSSRRELLAEAKGELERQFGAVDDVSEIMDFGFTHYYDEEMGAPLLRQFVSFEKLVAPESLVEAKHATNALEQDFAGTWLRHPASPGFAATRTSPQTTTPGLPRATSCTPYAYAYAYAYALPDRRGALPRPINLDPGFVDSPKLVLASMKNFAHRLYLGRGVYAEITLLHRRGRWTPLEWTFPDYASGLYWPFLDRARRRLREQLGAASGTVLSRCASGRRTVRAGLIPTAPPERGTVPPRQEPGSENRA